MGFPGDSDSKESSCNAGDLGSIPGFRRSGGEENSYPLQYSGLENSMDCIVHRVTESDERLSHAYIYINEQIHKYVYCVCTSIYFLYLLKGPRSKDYFIRHEHT